MSMKKKLDEILAKYRTAVERQQEIMSAAEADDGRDLTEAEQLEFDGLDAEIKKFEKAAKDVRAMIDRDNAMAEVGDVEVRSAAPTRRTPDEVDVTQIRQVTTRNPGGSVPAVPVNREVDMQEVVAACVWAAARAKHYHRKSPLEHLEEFGMQRIADMSRETTHVLGQTKSFTSLVGGGGDNTIDTPLSREFIDWLKNESAFLAGGPITIDLPMGSLEIAGGLAGTGGTYTAEAADSPFVQATTRKIALNAKILKAHTAISNHVIEISPLPVAALLSDELMAGMRISLDSAGLRGGGTGANPAGVLTLTHASHKIAATATAAAPTLAAVEADLKAMETLAIVSNIPRRRQAWTMSGRTFIYLKYMRTGGAGDGLYAFPELHESRPMLKGRPVIVSEQVPSNLGVGTNESEIYLADYGHIIFAVTRALRLAASDEASYKDAGGTLVSAFSRDETVIRATGSHDFDMRYDKAAVVLQGVVWGD